MNPPETVLAFLVVAGGLWVLRPVATAIAKRIASETGRPGADPDETAELRAELAQLRQELGEMAERLDFAERLLAQQRETPRLGGGRS